MDHLCVRTGQPGDGCHRVHDVALEAFSQQHCRLLRARCGSFFDCAVLCYECDVGAVAVALAKADCELMMGLEAIRTGEVDGTSGTAKADRTKGTGIKACNGAPQTGNKNVGLELVWSERICT